MVLDEKKRTLAEMHVRELLQLFGHDVDREGLKSTPKRYIQFMEQFMVPEGFAFTTFSKENYNEMIVQKGISFFSLCEHHMAPFFGIALVAYIPNDRILGLSKLARCLRYYAAGLQNQERITMLTATRLQEALEPKGVAVILEARHLCMEMRGVKTFGATTTTSAMFGVFLEQAATRAELLSLLQQA